jgi:uncharacterized membrane protein
VGGTVGDEDHCKIEHVHNYGSNKLHNTQHQSRRKPMNPISTLPPSDKKAKELAILTYALYAASFLVGITCIFAIVVNYIKKDDVVGTFVESHFRWQIRTFWFGLLWGVIGIVLLVVLVGWLVIVANSIWVIYRLVKGFIRLNDNLPMYV